MSDLIQQDALIFHSRDKPGKLEMAPTKPLLSERDLSLAYSPGVAAPVKEIFKDPDAAYKYTNKGNMVAVITNGTAILGLGNLGALASKPVMEGKAVLFKRFADIDSFDLEVDTEDPEAFINCVRYLEPAFAGINLEDIKAPESFIIEKRLNELMDIPVFHDDQHGTAVVVLAGVLNALHLTKKTIETAKFVLSGAGSSAMAVAKLLIATGVPTRNLIMCDSKGVINTRRTNLDKWRSEFCVDTQMSTLSEAFVNSDVAIGLSAAGAFSKEMISSMAQNPIVFALANPDPEMLPEEIEKVRPDALIATGRSDYANQVNNVLCFPYIFRGALNVRARSINEDMKIACAEALAELARLPVPDCVCRVHGQYMAFSKNYILPSPFDPRLKSLIPDAVSRAAIMTGVARQSSPDYKRISGQIKERLIAGKISSDAKLNIETH